MEIKHICVFILYKLFMGQNNTKYSNITLVKIAVLY